MADEITKVENGTIVEPDVEFNIPKGNICTVDITTNEGKVALTKALNGSESLKNHMDEVLNVTGIITTPGTRAVSGVECTNTYLVLEDGTTLFTQSDGVARSVKVITALWGAQLAQGQTVQLKCIQQQLNNGNTLKTIVPA